MDISNAEVLYLRPRECVSQSPNCRISFPERFYLNQRGRYLKPRRRYLIPRSQYLKPRRSCFPISNPEGSARILGNRTSNPELSTSSPEGDISNPEVDMSNHERYLKPRSKLSRPRDVKFGAVAQTPSNISQTPTACMLGSSR